MTSIGTSAPSPSPVALPPGTSLGLVGLGVMGRNLALNAADRGARVVAWDGWEDARGAARPELAGAVEVVDEVTQLVAALPAPRQLLVMVKAGSVAGEQVAALLPLLKPGDAIFDGGNEHFTVTEVRARKAAAVGVHHLGVGISGGEVGARTGPSIMVGGPVAAYERAAPLLEAIAARHGGRPCVARFGPDGAGHHVKMVHNGIEYGDMELLAETWLLLRAIGLEDDAVAERFEAHARGPNASYLSEVSAIVLRRRDDDGALLLDRVHDAAGMKGTGTWTVQDGLTLGVPVPTIAAAVTARQLSARHADRAVFSEGYPVASGPVLELTPEDLDAALLLARAVGHAEGLELLRVASEARGWAVPRVSAVRVWRAGCIIRSSLLGPFEAALTGAPDARWLLGEAPLAPILAQGWEPLRTLVRAAALRALPVPAFSAALGHLDAMRRKILPTQLVQAQRDHFGAHGYRRLDRPGDHHSDWAGQINE